MDHHLIPLIGALLGLPALAWSLRIVIRGVADGIVRVKGGARNPLPDPEQARRMAELESEVGALREEVARLGAVESFYAQLQAPPKP